MTSDSVAIELKDNSSTKRIMYRPTPNRIARFQHTICNHFAAYGRVLPWRSTRDPHRILVSEIMLQQTQVERVLAKYEEFLDDFPDIESLAAGPLRHVLAAWQGLGYNRRTIALQRTARQTVNEFEGLIPPCYNESPHVPRYRACDSRSHAGLRLQKAVYLH